LNFLPAALIIWLPESDFLGRVRPLATERADSHKEESMITGVHTMFYSSEPEALRAFLRDKLGFPFTDVGEGWLIFDLPEAEMGCHPADPPKGPLPGRTTFPFTVTILARPSRN